MHQVNIQSKRSISNGEQLSFQNVCACKRCDHGLARDCLKSGCKCCEKENHSMVMDGIKGFFPADKEMKSK